MVDVSHILIGELIGNTHRLRGRGKWLYGPCPACGGGRGSDRFYVNTRKNYFKCRQCKFSGGPLDWIAWLDGYDLKSRDDFQAACAALGIRLNKHPQPTRTAPKPMSNGGPPLGTWRDDAPVFQADYQENAVNFCGMAFDALRESGGERAYEWLRERGLRPAVLDAFGIGYNPTDTRQQWSTTLDKPVWLPRGIVIPWETRIDEYHRVNIRRPAGNPKYISAAGYVNSLYNAAAVRPGCNVVMVEGEFDALLIEGLANLRNTLNLVPVATGTVTGARVGRWVTLLATANRVFTAFDREAVGYQAHLWWLAALPNKVTRLRPTHHDVTEMWRAGGNDAISQWLWDAIKEVAA